MDPDTMDLIYFTTSFLIGIGAIIMALNIIKFHGVIQILKNIDQLQYNSLRPILLFHHALIVSFFAGYIAVLIAINSTQMSIGNFFVSIIFFSGAVFVLLGIVLQKRMIKSIEAIYKEALIANKNLSLNQQELSRTNLSLKQEIKKTKDTEATLQRSYDTQKIVNQILRKSLTGASIPEVVDHCLDLVLSLPWLSFDAQGCIYLVEEKSDVLVLKTHRGFSDELQKECKRIPFGKCLCGLAALKQEPVFSSHIDARHDILLPGTPDHGHYCIPILSKGSTIGIINIYVKPGHIRKEREENFLKAVANTMAIILMQHYAEEQKNEMATRLQHSQKMESIGTLAGGIAHDFNNILSGIFGYAQLAEKNIGNRDKVRNHLHQIDKGAHRASDLIQQILAFSRKSGSKKTPIRLNLIVKEAISFLRSSMPATISIHESIDSKAYIKADATGIHQIMMNLCTNAFHAMKQTGGKLSVSLSEVTINTPHDVSNLNITPGPYLELKISDTGHGIPQEIQNKIFEPYFTTKKVKEGTGLGLAVVLGIVQAHKGRIKLESHAGKGSTFHIYFPQFVERRTSKEDSGEKEIEIQGGTEKILMVDDEKSILMSTSALLKDYGYAVDSFSDSTAAFEAFKTAPDTFDLIITDMTMPAMTGEELSLKIFDLKKEVPIILCTGYSDNISKNKALKLGIKKYLQKPIDNRQLLVLIRKIFDENNAISPEN